MVNTPIPHNLKSEAKKAAKILRGFTMPNSKIGPDKLIPVGILAKARGLAILTVFKAGFLVTARGGSGIVIAKVRDELDYSEGWSAPSAIGLAGLGGGFEVGMEVTDFVIILNTQAAVDAFSKGGNLTLGGNFTIAVGPLGRNLEGDVAVRSPAAIYTYSKTKGIFAGISVEGSALIERKDANRKFYGREIRAYEILAGEVTAPEECVALYQVMKEHQELAARAALRLAKKEAARHADTASHHLANATGLSLSSFSRSSKSGSSFSQKSVVTKMTVTKKMTSSSGKSSFSSDHGHDSQHMKTVTCINTTYVGDSMDRAAFSTLTSSKVVTPVDQTSCTALALFHYQAQLSCDLSFFAGKNISCWLQHLCLSG
ncbi:SH3 domain-containing YSC84-like protein 1 isoform X2 [Babylonia areolata]|uniref:SH3 domain-containing YSC84-like protein 1 isoform X2 n=1 Tax=Babylonia areolata TaxID=304850 RepID=UPI003FD4ED10